ncbi:hypothetical protein CONLIGDRAFT_648305 [Coniochaeta ligniaria NRRL 30616]|uniref:Uncharacterized protein n=1 Tax=Coniochaeta ligniaria NRRL 30616 TaxID=1408157 RepID=A0A1J7J7W7_9PEZI|nr:hypothetical protein CONLIGDRAFT_648305 [Coniochaeta ligniaria NRRL 30616]
MCRHITTIYRCNSCNERIHSDKITCDASWSKRLGRQPCDDTDWTMVEDDSEKLCVTCAERRGSKPIVPDVPSTVAEQPSVLGPFNEFNAYTARFVNMRLAVWLKIHPERAAVPGEEDAYQELMGAIARAWKDIAAANAGDAGGSSGSDSDEDWTTQLAMRGVVNPGMLFTNVQTRSPEELDEDGFEKEKGNGGINPGSGLGGLVNLFCGCGWIIHEG